MKCYNEACFNYTTGVIENCKLPTPRGCTKILTEPPLKYGDEIEVRDKDHETWSKRIFAKFEDDLVYCHSRVGDEGQFSLTNWKLWRRPSPSLTWEDRDKLRGRWIRRKGEEKEMMIMHISVLGDGRLYINNSTISDTIIKEWEFIDGTPII